MQAKFGIEQSNKTVSMLIVYQSMNTSTVTYVATFACI